MLNIGDMAPDFTLPNQTGTEVTLTSLHPQTVVLYFYPKDNTPGCTTEALDFTAKLAEFDAAGVKILGVSKDSVKKHSNFIAKHALGIDLISDQDGTLCEDFGTWVEKQMYGKTYMGIERATFVIDATGRISHIWRKVKVKGHVDEVLAAVTAT